MTNGSPSFHFRDLAGSFDHLRDALRVEFTSVEEEEHDGKAAGEAGERASSAKS